MLDKLIATSLAQRMLMVVLTLMLVGAGIQAMRDLPIDAFPDVSSTQVKIIMKAPGMTPEEVETRIVAPIEQEMLGIPNQRLLRSMSKYGIADITLDFNDGTDIYWARQQATERLNQVLGVLPATASGGLAPITTPLGEVFMFTIEGPLSLTDKRSLLDWVIRPQLRSIPGVADVNSLGGFVKSFSVVPDPVALAARQVSLAQLQTALETNNRNDGAGRLTDQGENLLVRSEGSIKSIDDVKAIGIIERQGMAVRVGDVADVRIDGLTRYGAVTKDAHGEAVEGLVLGLRGSNARQVVVEVEKRLKDISTTLPQGTHVVPFYNRGDLVGRAVFTVAKALTEAIILVLILLYVFLGNVRAALVVALILPLSALATFIGMHLVNLSANLMSLGGLAIAIGMLVDAAVVVVENIESQQSQQQHGIDKPWLHIVYRATQEVAVPITAGMAIIVIVFLPLLTLQGLEGKLFVPVALTIVFALTASLLLSLTVIPVLASFVMGGQHHPQPKLVSWLEARYRRWLDRALAHQRTVYVAAGLALIGAAGLFGVLGKSFMPNLDEGDILLQVEKIPSISLEDSTRIDQDIQRALLKRIPEIQNIIARVGADELGLDPMGFNDTDTFLVLKPKSEWSVSNKDALVDKVRKAVADIPGVNLSFTQPIEMRTSEMLSGVRGDFGHQDLRNRPAHLERAGRTDRQAIEHLSWRRGCADRSKQRCAVFSGGF